EEGVAYLERLDSPNVKLMLDTFHMNIEESSLGEAVQTAGDQLGHLHIGENNRTPPGRGHLPWPELVESLHSVGYEGSVVMEPFLKPGGTVGRDIRVYRDLAQGMDLDREAVEALQFMRDQFDKVGRSETPGS
ncbi:MAG: sugar phosphate isomerase/epimerase, partial [Anaerolineales bacterium]|nr:sugar phosphate isomerase/epimerase [Anaerolineales bacterium]